MCSVQPWHVGRERGGEGEGGGGGGGGGEGGVGCEEGGEDGFQSFGRVDLEARVSWITS